MLAGVCGRVTKRVVGQEIRRCGARASISFFSEGPSVDDVTVKVTFVDDEGIRTTVPARTGMNLHNVATLHNIDIGPQSMGDPMFRKQTEKWTEELFGEGPSLGFDHVMIPKEWMPKFPPRVDKELELLAVNWEPEEINEHSRLASLSTNYKRVRRSRGLPTTSGR